MLSNTAEEGADASGKPLPDSSYQSYLFSRAGKGEAPAWSDSMKGRFAIRMVSRGVVGSLFFVLGSRLANQQMRGYHPEAFRWEEAKTKPLQIIAKGIDETLGVAIEKTVATLARLKHTPEEAARIGKKAVTFRGTRTITYRDHQGVEHQTVGRSYGSDIVSFTTDFAMMSIGDAYTRNIIQALDPNIKKTWLVNDEGKPALRDDHKHFLFGEWLRSMGRTSWRVFSKNQGEDWVAAIPYAFQMKFQRQFLSNIFNKRFDGHKLVFDHAWNGGAYRINAEGKIVGDLQLVGALDLHARFVGYNWYTQMFREGYDALANKLHPKPQTQDPAAQASPAAAPPPSRNPVVAAVDGLGTAASYVTKSFIKANMYMNPAVVPFWLIRVPQSKWRGKYFIEGEPARFGPKTNIWKDVGDLAAGERKLDPFAWENYQHYPTATRFDRVEKRFSQSLNWIGIGCDRLGRGLANFGESMANKGFVPKSRMVRKFIQGDQDTLLNGGRRLAHEVVDASLAYTPYMFAKQEFGLRVDDRKGDGSPGKMDQAIYTTMHDVAGFRWNRLGRDIKEMWRLGTRIEDEFKVREAPEPQHPKSVVLKDGLVREATTPVQAHAAPSANDSQWRSTVRPVAERRDAAANDPLIVRRA